MLFAKKAGKSSHVNFKDFRPISNSSLLLKTLERLMDLYIRGPVLRDMLLRAQHAYNKGRSVDVALHAVLSWLE